MKKFKLPLLAIAIIMAIGSAIAATLPAKQPVEETYFKLVENGNPLDRMDWEPASAGSCPTEHTDIVCRILAVDDGGVPSETSFNAILSATADFSQAYTDKVTYEPEP